MTALGRLEYITVVSNGRGRNPSEKQRTLDLNNDKAFDVSLGFSPACCDALRFGGTFRYDEIPPNLPVRHSMTEFIGSGFVELRLKHIEGLAEFAYIGDDVHLDGGHFGNHSGYVQVGYRIEDWLPYTRFDYREMDLGDPFYSVINRDLDAWLQILGLRWDFTPNSAIKVEVGGGRGERRRGADVSENTIITAAIQLSWVI